MRPAPWRGYANVKPVIRAHSFDVFDTLLVRTRARHVDLFRAAAERAVGGDPADPGRTAVVAEAARRRRTGELQAIERSGLDAVGLDAVYAELEDLRAFGVDPAEMRRCELEIEREEARPLAAGIERVRAARAAGRRILFVSDMYLPGEFIRANLERFEIALPGEPLYVSGELGISKRTGRMFDHLLREEGLEAGELVHTGDDPLTDDASPATRGIAREPLTVGRLSRMELEVLARSQAPRPVAGRIVGCARAARITDAPEDGELRHASTFGADVAGLLFSSYVAWVLRTAREEGIQRLYFVSRDAQIYLRIAKLIAREGDPECRYLLGSRQAWFLPAIDEVNPEALHWLLKPEWALRTPRAILAKLAIAPEEVSSELYAHGFEADSEIAAEEVPRFWELIDAIGPVILSTAERERETVVGYLRQEGMLDPGRWALVDLGWRLTAQSALRRILGLAGHPEHVVGFYFAINSRRSRLRDSGSYRAFFVEDDEPGAGEGFDAWLYCHQDVIEQVFAMADHGSCTGYRHQDGEIVPVLREQRSDPRRSEFGARLQDTIAACAAELHRAGLLGDHLDAVRAAGAIAGRLAVESPTHEEAAALGWLPVGDDQNESRLRPLAAALTPPEVEALRSPDGVPDGSFEAGSLWPEGSLALTEPVQTASE